MHQHDRRTDPLKGPPAGKSQLAERQFRRLLDEISRPGFYGTAGLLLSVQDGHIQHIRLQTERRIQ